MELKNNKGIPAVCHDWRHAVGGVLRKVSDGGCELVTEDGATSPAFEKRARVLLNLLDPETGTTKNVPARFIGCSRRDGKWSYRFQW